MVECKYSSVNPSHIEKISALDILFLHFAWPSDNSNNIRNLAFPFAPSLSLYPIFSKGTGDLKQNRTQEKTRFSGMVLHAFVPPVDLICYECNLLTYMGVLKTPPSPDGCIDHCNDGFSK